jgi:hypothetical protein
MTDRRGQVSLSLIEAGVGVVLLLTVTMGFALGLPQPETREPQLDLYAQDTAAVLTGEPPRHQGQTRLGEILDSKASFRRERDALARRVGRIVPDNLMYRVETPHGAVGFQKPADVAVGKATVTTASGDVTIRVWYA